MAPEQRDQVRALLVLLARGLTHGDCVGADKEAGELCQALGLPVRKFPSTSATRAWTDYGELVASPADPLARNKDIIRDGEIVIATPGKLHEELRSGTWAAIRFARKMAREIWIVWPDGRVTKDR